MELPLAAEARAAIAAAAPASGGGAAPAAALLPGAMLHAARLFLGLARLLPYEIPERLAETVTADLAAIRSGNRAAGPEQLYRLAGLARLLALSHGETQLTAERWEEAKRLDAACRMRLPAAAAAGGAGGAGGAAVAASGAGSPAGAAQARVGVVMPSAAPAGGPAVGASPLLPASTGSGAASPR